MNNMNDKIINENDICKNIKNNNPTISSSALKWELHHFIKNNSLTKVGIKKYIENGKTYSYNYYSNLTLSIDNYLSKRYPEIKMVIWESRQLNEWLNFLMSDNIIYIEIEKEYLDYVFSSINSFFGDKHLVLYNPTNEEIYRYSRNDLIVVKTLYSKSPLNKNNHKIKIEKLLVDILCNDVLMDSRSIEDIILGIKDTYDIDIDKALAYASRRRRKQELIKMWGI